MQHLKEWLMLAQVSSPLCYVKAGCNLVEAHPALSFLINQKCVWKSAARFR